jgi:hypothetical protein
MPIETAAPSFDAIMWFFFFLGWRYIESSFRTLSGTPVKKDVPFFFNKLVKELILIIFN